MGSPVDTATFRALEDAAGRDFVAELVATFRDEAPRMLEELRTALAARDEATFRRSAHSLKSNSLTFGAMGLGAQARELETTAHVVVARGDAAALDALAAEQERVAAALEELCRG